MGPPVSVCRAAMYVLDILTYSEFNCLVYIQVVLPVVGRVNSHFGVKALKYFMIFYASIKVAFAL